MDSDIKVVDDDDLLLIKFDGVDDDLKLILFDDDDLLFGLDDEDNGLFEKGVGTWMAIHGLQALHLLPHMGGLDPILFSICTSFFFFMIRSPMAACSQCILDS